MPRRLGPSTEVAERYPSHRDRVEVMTARGELARAREWTIADLHVALQLFRRP